MDIAPGATWATLLQCLLFASGGPSPDQDREDPETVSSADVWDAMVVSSNSTTDSSVSGSCLHKARGSCPYW